MGEIRWSEGSGEPTSPVSTGSNENHEVDGLKPQTYYSFEVRATLAAERSPWSSATLTTPRPAAPTGLTASAASESAVSLSWDEVGAADSYELERTELGEDPVVIPGVANDRYEDRGLEADTQYRYRVRTVVERGPDEWRSVWNSPPAEVTTLGEPTELGPPTGFAGETLSPFSIELVWDEIAGVDNYEIRRTGGGSAFAATITVSGDRYVDGDLAPDTEYGYLIRVADEMQWSEAIAVETLEFEAPDNFRATAESASVVRLNWDALPGDGLTYRVRHRQTGGDRWLHPTDVTETTLTVTGLEAGTTYQFRIFVLYWTEAGTRYRSGEADVTTTTPSQ